MNKKEKSAWAAEQVAKKYKEIGRIPKKEDFDDAERSRIKAYLGPWPRVLEAAGLKTPRSQKKSSTRKNSKEDHSK